MALEFYNPDAAKISRGVTASCLGSLLLYGSLSLYDFLAEGWWMTPLPNIGEALGEEFPLAPRTFLCLALIAGSGYFIYWLVNYKKYVDYLVETEAELKKVTWPSKPEVTASSIIVVVTTILLGVYIFAVDYLLISIKNNVDPSKWFG